MPMKKIPLEQLKPGMKFTKSLFDKNLNIVLPAGKPLDDISIKNLKLRSLDFVETAGELVDETLQTKAAEGRELADKKKIKVDKDTARYLEIYKESVTTINALYGRYRSRQGFNVDEVQKLANKLVNTVMMEKNPNVFINLVNITGRGEYLFHHIVNVTLLGILLGQRIGYSMVKLVSLAMAGLLYDIGMTKIPAYIVEKEGKLSPEERNQINTHPIHSYQTISREFNLPTEIARVGLEHHEKWDGTGYPRKIKGNEISEMSRMLAIVDTYEALIKSRVYREKNESYDAMKLVVSEGSKRFDPDLLKVFLNMMSIYPVGGFVRLNNNAIAKVISADAVSPFRPTVKIVYDEFGDKIEDGEVIRLSKEKDIYIVGAVKTSQLNDSDERQ
ncbi:MAG: HD-GYP domain-containing protein [Brevinematales bacterium]|nr:HD-GYP domain-containing protein [Brevinematales bacterium]